MPAVAPSPRRLRAVARHCRPGRPPCPPLPPTPAASPRTLPRVAVVGTGGTISSVGKDSLDTIDYVTGGQGEQQIYTVGELLEQVPEALSVADVTAVPFRTVPSTEIGPPVWLELLELLHRVDAEQGERLDGIVITHGTASLEETAYFLSLTLKLTVPVVLVGSQRPVSGLSSDAGMNLVCALRVAGAPDSRGLGVLVVLNDEIHAAREVSKTATLRLQTFRSPDFGALGHADGDRIAYYRKPLRRCYPDTEFDVRGVAQLPRVDVVISYAGADGAAMRGCLAAGARGIVSAGFAPGGQTPGEREVARENPYAVLVQSTRVGSGRVANFAHLEASGVVSADNLSPQKARVLLMLALHALGPAPSFAELSRVFATY